MYRCNQPPEDGCYSRTQSAIRYAGLRQLDNIHQHFGVTNQTLPHNFTSNISSKATDFLTSLNSFKSHSRRDCSDWGFTWLSSQSPVEYWFRATNVHFSYPHLFLTFRGPCFVIYSYNKNQRDALFLKFILIKNSTCFGKIYCSSSGVLTLRRLMSYIYGAPILDVSRSHTTTQHSR